MLERFEIDNLIYEVWTCVDNDVGFAIVGGANAAFNSETYDPFLRPEEWAIRPRITRDIEVTRYPLRVYRAVLKRIENWIGNSRPYGFTFSLLSDRRRWIYERVARRLSERFDYDLQITGRVFRFYKLKEGS